MNISTYLSTVSTLKSRTLGILGALLIVSGATLFLAPSYALASFAGTQLGGATISSDGHTFTYPAYQIACTGSETVHRAMPIWISDSSVDFSTGGTPFYDNVTCGTDERGSGFNTAGFAGFAGATVDIETYYSPYTGNQTPPVTFGLYFWRDGLGCTWAGPSCVPNNAVAGNVKITRSPSAVWSVDNGAVPDTSTHFITLTPLNGDTVSSSSPVTVGAHIYISPNDYESGMYLNLAFTSRTVQQVGGSALDAWNSATGNAGIQIPIVASGDMTLSTTTNFTYDGSATGVYSIRKPTFLSSLWFVGIYFSPDTLISTSTTFIVGQKTALDYFNEATTTNGLVSTFLTGTTTPIISCDNVFSGGLGTCLLSLIVPTSDSMSIAFNQLKDNVLTRMPIGYATRFVTILSGSTGAVEPPELSYTFGSSSPSALQGKTYAINVFDSAYFSSSSPLLSIKADDGTNKNVWDIIDPFISFICIVGVLFVVLEDLMGFSMPVRDPNQFHPEISNSFTDKEIRKAIEKGGGMNLTEEEYRMRIRNRL